MLERLKYFAVMGEYRHANPDSAERLKSFLSKGLINVLSREETARTLKSELENIIQQGQEA